MPPTIRRNGRQSVDPPSWDCYVKNPASVKEPAKVFCGAQRAATVLSVVMKLIKTTFAHSCSLLTFIVTARSLAWLPRNISMFPFTVSRRPGLNFKTKPSALNCLEHRNSWYSVSNANSLVISRNTYAVSFHERIRRICRRRCKTHGRRKVFLYRVQARPSPRYFHMKNCKGRSGQHRYYFLRAIVHPMVLKPRVERTREITSKHLPSSLSPVPLFGGRVRSSRTDWTVSRVDRTDRNPPCDAEHRGYNPQRLLRNRPRYIRSLFQTRITIHIAANGILSAKNENLFVALLNNSRSHWNRVPISIKTETALRRTIVAHENEHRN